MKIFGTLQPLVESKESSLKIGRLVANYVFFKALFKYSDFDQFHIFCPTFANCQLTQQKIAAEDIPPDQKAKIKIMHITSLKRSLAANDYHVFHLCGWGFFLPGLIHLRNSHAKNLFPVTGLTHSLNIKDASFHALKASAAPAMPFDSIICTSNCGKKVMQNLFDSTKSNFPAAEYQGRLDIIPLGIDDGFKTIPDRTQSRKLLDIDIDAFVILSLGRLACDNKMDYAPFLATIKRFAEKNKDKKINFLLAGSANPAEQKLITDLISENHLEQITKLHVNFQDSLKPHMYSAADVYAAPIDNLQETFGLSVLEAMAGRCVPVISDFNGYSELVDHELTGLKVPTYWAKTVDDFHEISEIMNFSTYQMLLSQSIAVDFDYMNHALQQLIDNPQKLNALAIAARKKVKENYFWSDIIKRYCSLWSELSVQAGRSTADFKKTANPWAIDYASVFSHYPSNLVTDLSTISITEFGRQTLASGQIPQAYSDVAAAIIIPQLIDIALQAAASTPLTAKKLIKHLQTQAEITDSTAMYYLLWMTKYNLLKISTSTATP